MAANGENTEEQNASLGGGDVECNDEEKRFLQDEKICDVNNTGGDIEIEENGLEFSDDSPQMAPLLKAGIDRAVAVHLVKLFKKGKLTLEDIDSRAIEGLKQFRSEGAIDILFQFDGANLDHVSNKSAFLCGMMKTWRQKEKMEKSNWSGANNNTAQSSSNSSSTNANAKNNNASSSSSVPQTQQNGPDEAKIKAILQRTGYSLDVTTGQRKYGGPPPDWDGSPPGAGCEIFVGKIPKEIFEDDLIPLFEKIGKIWDLRLMMDPLTGLSRGYAFITFCNKDDASNAVQELDGYEVRKGKPLKINVSVPNLRLFVGNIPKSKSKEEILQEFSKLAAGLVEVIVYNSPDDRKKNRGFCFLEYESHKAASMAKRKLSTARTKVWGCDILVDWADPQEEPDEETMSKVKVLYVRNLTSEVTEEQLKAMFDDYGSVERVKKIKDYAFVHFEDRDCALKAMNELNGRELGGAHVEISLAKPPSDRKKKEEVLRNRERRVMMMMQQRAMMIGVPRGPSVMTAQQTALPPPPPPPPPLIPQPPRGNSRNRNAQPPLAPSAYHRPLARNYEYEFGYYGHDYPPPHYDYHPHFSGDGFYHHHIFSPAHAPPQPSPVPLPSAHNKSRASRTLVRGGIRGMVGMNPARGGMVPEGRVGLRGPGPHMGAMESYHRSHQSAIGGPYGNPATLPARNLGSSKRRVAVQKGVAKRKVKSKGGDNDSKQNRNQQNSNDSGAQGGWFEDEEFSNFDRWEK